MYAYPYSVDFLSHLPLLQVKSDLTPSPYPNWLMEIQLRGSFSSLPVFGTSLWVLPRKL